MTLSEALDYVERMDSHHELSATPLKDADEPVRQLDTLDSVVTDFRDDILEYLEYVEYEAELFHGQHLASD